MLLTKHIENLSFSSRLVRIGLGLALLAPAFLPQSWNSQLYGLMVLISALPILSGITGYCPLQQLLYQFIRLIPVRQVSIVSMLLVAGSVILLASLFLASNQTWLFRHHDSLTGIVPILVAIFAVEIIGRVSSQLMPVAEQGGEPSRDRQTAAYGSASVNLPNAA